MSKQGKYFIRSGLKYYDNGVPKNRQKALTNYITETDPEKKEKLRLIYCKIVEDEKNTIDKHNHEVVE